MPPIHVLVVNAQPLDQPLLDVLHEPGFQVEQYQFLPDVAVLVEQQPEILLVDADSLPADLLYDLKKEVTYTVIIILDGGSLERKINYLNAGADAYFERPVSPAVVLAHLLSLLRRKTAIDTDVIVRLLSTARNQDQKQPKRSILQKAVQVMRRKNVKG
ncbi:MAG: hypothetical protein KJ064_07455 [Anaerolineae bacterium]|nr:hypothetical protein [Anaerolineae bacterium]